MINLWKASNVEQKPIIVTYVSFSGLVILIKVTVRLDL